MMLSRLRKAACPVACVTIASFVVSMFPQHAWADEPRERQVVGADAPMDAAALAMGINTFSM